VGSQNKDARELRRVAEERFGYEGLRPGQEEAILSVLEGNGTMAVMPTGSGKPAIYQVAALMMPGPTVVIPPLIALQRDQVEGIEGQGAANASQLNSSVPGGEREKAFEELEAGELEFIFPSPRAACQRGDAGADQEEEALADRGGRGALHLGVGPRLPARLSEAGRRDRRALDQPTALAMTATASPMVREEIFGRLRMRDPHLIVRGFDRPNIWLGVERFEDERAKREALLERVAEAEKPGIVYAATRKGTGEIAEALRERGVGAVHYHGGMKNKAREKNAERFLEDGAEVMVSTAAFGMGVDKENVRFVYHHDITDSVDSYYQEIGPPCFTGRRTSVCAASSLAAGRWMRSRSRRSPRLSRGAKSWWTSGSCARDRPLPGQADDGPEPPRGGRGGRDDPHRRGRPGRKLGRRRGLQGNGPGPRASGEHHKHPGSKKGLVLLPRRQVA
jgi:ATP-dependent DNA helicase RecQ